MAVGPAHQKNVRLSYWHTVHYSSQNNGHGLGMGQTLVLDENLNAKRRALLQQRCDVARSSIINLIFEHLQVRTRAKNAERQDMDRIYKRNKHEIMFVQKWQWPLSILIGPGINTPKTKTWIHPSLAAQLSWPWKRTSPGIGCRILPCQVTPS